jgi:hypothetical protein
MKNILIAVFSALILFSGCKKDDPPASNEPSLIVKLTVDSTQVRLGNIGTPVSVPAGHAAQNPHFNKIAAHYMELAPSPFTLLGQGEILYHAPETNIGGATAIDFSKSKIVTPGDVFLVIPLKDITPGTYTWVRLSLSFQNFDVDYYLNGSRNTGTIASFVGYNTYLTDYTVKTQTVSVNGNRLQGYWGFETLGFVTSGQAPAGATTVPNPLFNTSPIPQGSCVVTGDFALPLVITGNETADIVATMSLSTNNSFEWIDSDGNGHWDINSTTQSIDTVVDMGLRGLVPSWQ